MAVVLASDLAKDMAGEPLLRGVSFKLERRDRMTLSGRNGSGKTTLLRMLSGETGIDGGELVFAKDVRVALHDQRPPRDRDLTLRDYVLSGCRELLALEERAGAAGGGDGRRRDRTTRPSTPTRRRRPGSSTPAATTGARRSTRRCTGSGSATSTWTASLETFSGGELTRASLARALAGDPDLLLLDEPTNHLDIASLEWLEAHLQTLDAAVVLVAHDRWFLEAVGTSVLELEAGRAKFFKGTWHAWRVEKAQRELALGPRDREAAGRDRQARALRHPLPRGHARAPGAGAGRRSSTRSSGSTRDPQRRQGARLRVQAARALRPRRLRARGRRAARSATRTLLQDAELWLERGEHVSLVGANGSGKTTLITALTGGRELDGGKLRRGHNVKLGLLAQHARGASGCRPAPCSRPASARPG